MDVETGVNSQSDKDMSPSCDGLRKRTPRLSDEVIEQLVMKCSTDEEYEKVASELLAEAPSPAAVSALREKLQILRQVMRDREIQDTRQRKVGMIDDTFLSVTFALALVVIVGVMLYGFRGLFSAISKKLPVNSTRPKHRGN